MPVQISKSYQPEEVEARLYRWWEESGFFGARTDSEKPVFSMVMPPPNVTGSLHMGHALNHTLQDILVRWKRMSGFNALWVPGTDHAGIATQNVVERQLAEEGLHRSDLGREKFEQRVWEWKEIAQNNILSQVRRLGCSCDWSRLRFSMDEGLSRAVRQVFVELYREGLIYRGEYLVNWCPRCSTAISDLEVEYQPLEGSLWHIKYPVEGTDEVVVVATTRPETMLGDTAVAVHPDDERYHHLKGRSIRLPLLDRVIPVVFDSFVESEFGTGVVKVTPGHDPNDFEAGKRNSLPIIKVIDERGIMTAEAGPYSGLDRFEARSKVVADLEKLGLLEKVEKHSHNVGHCHRCGTIIEPLVSTQWFVKVKPLAERAIEAVEQGRTRFVPENYTRVYFEWMRNIHDWCISRQLWWGHRIPAWYCGQCNETIVSEDEPDTCSQCGSGELVQETDVLDTWFSSGLWPFSTLGWPEKTPELKVFYPNSVLVTAFDIIFFWVARMMMMGLRFMNDVPFRQVYINGLVRDENNQKMSKSRGNIIDPIEVIDQYGTDAVRFTLAVMAVPGTDIPFSISRMAGYRAFCNKIWNAARFLLMNLEDEKTVNQEEIESLMQSGRLDLEDRWILARLNQIVQSTHRGLEKYLFHEVSNELYHFFWHELCDWYIELIKADITGNDPVRKKKAQTVATYVLETSLRLLHPFIPFITEELWQKVPHQGQTIMTAPYPEPREEWIDTEAIARMSALQELITAVRTARAENNVDPKKPVPMEIRCKAGASGFVEDQARHLQNLAQLSRLDFVSSFDGEEFQVQGVSTLGEFALLLGDAVDIERERQRIEKQVEQTRGEVEGLSRRLQNQSFLEKAPREVVETARQRYSEAIDRLSKLREKLERLPTP